ncbi:zinc-binding oxidoreductase, putative [Ichthyophthirius multifiliis]|uniref:Zinc-binding oxidoreductase, putative n=1 Tax=Ichthyophthirius multifiliis TaxID=5932 RepID=G0R141_ICHMU|nr:zinc-binding oxidoreductase, putative [Ichthyophthirius multifiliis]EGR28808.1 zinc-binding oxidoreductase, putative [Ichthyophthirius multifiliis]|eukprot:XP_004030044.1 zinc-binding oxidoreductase, putative [Ichthyophthirius multifiliis]
MQQKSQKAVIYTNQSPNYMQFTENHQIPSPDNKNIIIEVYSAAINPVDYKLPYIFGFTIKNNIVGYDFSGKITYVPPHITQFKVGDEVFGMNKGTLAEIIKVQPDSCVLKPTQLTHSEAAALPLACQTSLQSLRSYGKLIHGESDVLVIGGSGGCGYYGVQLSKILGAKSITAICSSKNFDFVKNQGADFLHDYNSPDGMLPKNKKFDIIYDTVSSPEDFDYYPEGVKLLKNEKSVFVAINGQKKDWVRKGFSKVLGNWVQKKQYQLMLLGQNQKDLSDIALWAKEGKIKSIIDSEYGLNQEEVIQAFDKLKSRRVVGKVIIKIKQ